MFEFIAQILNFFYTLVPNYAIAIMMMTLLVMLITTPLTLKGTKGMIRMQILQPEIKKIQERHRGGDKQEMNAEMMAFYQENELNPLGGCLPLLVQAPVFFILFRLIRGLTRIGEDGTFDPQYLDAGSKMYRALDNQTEMVSFGLDLAESTSGALGESIIHGFPYLVLILVMIGAQYLQQKQMSGRNPAGSAAMPQQQLLLKVMPAFFGVISINFAAALVVYWVTSSVYRIGLQAYITRSLYGDDDSLGAQANKAAVAARDERDAKKGKGSTDRSDGAGGKKGDGTKKAPRAGAGTGPSGRAAKASGPPESMNGSRRTTAPKGKPHPSSKKKKRKKR